MLLSFYKWRFPRNIFNVVRDTKEVGRCHNRGKSEKSTLDKMSSEVRNSGICDSTKMSNAFCWKEKSELATRQQKAQTTEIFTRQEYLVHLRHIQ